MKNVKTILIKIAEVGTAVLAAWKLVDLVKPVTKKAQGLIGKMFKKKNG